MSPKHKILIVAHRPYTICPGSLLDLTSYHPPPVHYASATLIFYGSLTKSSKAFAFHCSFCLGILFLQLCPVQPRLFFPMSLCSMSPHRETFHDYLKELPTLAPAFSLFLWPVLLFFAVLNHHLTLYLFTCLFILGRLPIKERTLTAIL